MRPFCAQPCIVLEVQQEERKTTMKGSRRYQKRQAAHNQKTPVQASPGTTSAAKTGPSTAISGKTPRRGRVENLRPFLPGTSGNPAGRPRTAALSQAYRNKLAELVPNDRYNRTFAQCIADRLVELAMGGNISAAQELADRAEGRARQSVEIHSVVLREAFERMNREELDSYAREGRLPAWFPHTEEASRESVG